MRRPPSDPKPARSFVIVSRQALIESNYSTVVCAPIFTERYGLPTQVNVGPEEGLKHDCAIHCDGLMSLEKSRLADYVGELSDEKKCSWMKRCRSRSRCRAADHRKPIRPA